MDAAAGRDGARRCGDGPFRHRARGFIRAEVLRWDDLVTAGSHTEAARRGLQRAGRKPTRYRTATS